MSLSWSWKGIPIPSVGVYILLSLFIIGLSVSVFILIVVHNAAFLLFFLLLSTFVICFIAWNMLNRNHKAALSLFVRSFPDSDLRLAPHGQLVKITGLASCGSVSLESSYEKATRCIYTSTLLYEYGRLGLKPVNVNKSCCQWSLAYCERFSTDFYITDRKSGIRVLVKAGSGCKVLPLICESNIVTTSGCSRILSTHLRKWLRDRNLPAEARLLRLEEGYVQEGSSVTVVGMLCKDNDLLMIVQPPQPISTGCLFQRLLFPVDVDGLVLGISDSSGPVTNPVVADELDSYLDEKVISRMEDFNILSWWKTNANRYPTLARIARDILAIPITTVASESAFNTSGRVVSSYHNKLHPSTLEALMCCQSWLRAYNSGMSLF
ncbi:hypothetical protein KPL70_009944 [Citrus sinensis]|nr:hypothetical protein KPL70_009944 [Citrus sinensis]